MNTMSNVKNVLRLSEQELRRGGKSSWHDQYRDSAWIFTGGLPFDLTEGDFICVFSQYGEVVNINLVRDKVNGKSKGYAFLCYEDQRSTDLAVDNLNGIKLLGRTIRVDHCENYKVPKDSAKNPVDEVTATLRAEGCAPKPILANPIKAEKKEEILKIEKEKKTRKPKKKKRQLSSDSPSDSGVKNKSKKRSKKKTSEASDESSDEDVKKKKKRKDDSVHNDTEYHRKRKISEEKHNHAKKSKKRREYATDSSSSEEKNNHGSKRKNRRDSSTDSSSSDEKQNNFKKRTKRRDYTTDSSTSGEETQRKRKKKHKH